MIPVATLPGLTYTSEMKLNSLQQSLLALLIITLAVISISQTQRPVAQSESVPPERSNFRIQDSTFYGEEFRLPIPSGYTIRSAEPTYLELDPPGEGPNPYSDETGEGTNPNDDIIITVTDEMIDKVFESEKEFILTSESVTVEGRRGYKYLSGEGIAGHYDYLIDMDGQRTLHLLTRSFDEELDKLVQTLKF